MVKKSKIIKIATVFVFLLALAAAGCSDQQSPSDSISKGKIIGVDPGAGVMSNTETAIEEYDLDYTLIASSTGGMASELTKALKEKRWIVVTAWTPNWIFVRYDMKYLEDPKGVYGDDEYLATLARKGLKEDKPGVYAILERFNWTQDDIGSVMFAIEDGKSKEVAAQDWIDGHRDQVIGWIGDDTTSAGEEVSIGYIYWDTEIASTSVLKKVFEEAGYTVKLSAVDVGPLYQAVANGDVDCTISSWLPVTQGSYWEKFKDDLVFVNRNLEGAKCGLVVPSYVTINSIDELNDAKEQFS